jgi:ATP-dependent RNA helicase RhlE
MLDMGFRPQINQILKHCPKNRQTLFFSETLPNEVRSLAYDSLRDPVTVEAAPQATTAEGVVQFVYPVDGRRKADLLLELLQRPGMDSVLVFTRTKFGADKLIAKLQSAGIKSAVMHGDRAMKDRVRALDAFRDGEARVLVATDVAQRGLDIEGISHVVNFDVPQDPDSYVHRVGRTARAGQKGEAFTFMSPGEIGELRAIEHHIGKELPKIELEGYGFGLATPEGGTPPAVSRKPVRGGRNKMGSRSSAQLTAEELEAVLRVG